MRELYILNQDDTLIATLTEETGLISTWFEDHLNQLSDEPFVFSIEANAENSALVKEENQVVFRDKEGELRIFVKKEWIIRMDQAVQKHMLFVNRLIWNSKTKL